MLFTKGAESAILPYATGGEIEKTRLHVDEFALVSLNISWISKCVLCIFVSNFPHRQLRVFRMTMLQITHRFSALCSG